MKAEPIILHFLGQKITLKSEGDPEVIQAAVQIASAKLEDAQRRVGKSSAHQIALIALLDLAEEYVRAKKRAASHKKKVEDRTGELFSLMESALK